MNKELQEDLGRVAVGFTEHHMRNIAAGDHSFTEYWLNTETELLATLQDVLVKHKDKHTFEEMIFFTLIMGGAVKNTMDDLHRFDKESEEEQDGDNNNRKSKNQN
tara:strand:+ start:3548 stop:3862 length:315 start_codon:yes stop_codon:yes gene_type:complete